MWLILVVTAHAAPACAGVDFTAAEACDTRACLTAALGAACLASLDALDACPALAGCDSYDPVCDPQTCGVACARAFDTEVCAAWDDMWSATRQVHLAVCPPVIDCGDCTDRGCTSERLGAACTDGLVALTTCAVTPVTPDDPDGELTVSPACRAQCVQLLGGDACRGDWRYVSDLWTKEWEALQTVEERKYRAELRTQVKEFGVLGALTADPGSHVFGPGGLTEDLSGLAGLIGDRPTVAAGGGGSGEGIGGLGAGPTGSVARERSATRTIAGATAVVGDRVHGCAVSPEGITCWDREVVRAPVPGQAASEGCVLRAGTARCGATDLGRALAIEGDEAGGCALRPNATLSCWGDNSGGALGDGSRFPRSGPVDVRGLVGVTAFDRDEGGCAVTATGVWCWGANDRGERVPGGPAALLAPAKVPLPERAWVGVAVGRTGNWAWTGAGEVWSWGPGAPELVEALQGVVEVVVWSGRACGRRDRGVVCPGLTVPELSGVVDLSAGDDGFCAAGTAEVTCWP